MPPAILELRQKVIAGKDLRAGGTWLGVNDRGLLVAILNRRVNGQRVPATDKRSRGLLCMDLLIQDSIASAKRFIEGHTESYNPFTVVFGDASEMYVSYNNVERILTEELRPGLHVFSSAAEFELHSVKAERANALFAALGQRVRPSHGETAAPIAALQSVLADHSLG